MFEFTEVNTTVGTSGFAAALIFTSVESAPKPTRFRAVTLNVYTTSAARVLAV